MADNEKYYYIKLKDNYFEQDNVKVLESMKNGHVYSLIIIKLYLKASKNDGQLMMTQSIPYDPSNVGILASVIGHDVDHVKEAIKLGAQLDLIRIIEGREIWMTEIQNMIGKSSTEADRIRIYRNNLDNKSLMKVNDVQMYDKCTPEIDRELELKRDTELKKKKEQEDMFAKFWELYPKKKSKGQAEKAWQKINPSLFTAIFDSLEKHKHCADWLKDEGKYIPYPATWLNAKGWEDEIEVSKPKNDPYKGINL